MMTDGCCAMSGDMAFYVVHTVHWLLHAINTGKQEDLSIET